MQHDHAKAPLMMKKANLVNIDKENNISSKSSTFMPATYSLSSSVIAKPNN